MFDPRLISITGQSQGPGQPGKAGYFLREIIDVEIPDPPENRSLLLYDAASGLWKSYVLTPQLVGAAPAEHTHPTATTTTPGFLSSADKSKLDGIQAGAEVNQNAYSHVQVGSSLVSALTKTDILKLVAGSNLALTPDASQRQVTLAVAPQGSGSGLDADTVDGQHASAFASANHNHDTAYVQKSGDTMTGALSAPEYRLQTGVPIFQHGLNPLPPWPTDNPLMNLPILSVEYWDGTSWVSWSTDATALFDGNWGRTFQVPYAQRHFRVTVQLVGSPLLNGLFFQSQYAGVNQSFTVQIEQSTDSGATWVTRLAETLIPMGQDGLVYLPGYIDGSGWWRFTFNFQNLTTGQQANVKVAAWSRYPGQVNRFPFVTEYDGVKFGYPVFIQGYRAWHAGNQGPGSGMDADTVDGQHASAFASASHTHPDATSSTAGFMSAADKTKLDGIQAGAQVNQNAFSSVKVGGTTIAATTQSDIVEIVAGSNVTLTPDATNKKITIAASGGSSANSFGVVRVGSTNVAATAPGDTVTLVAGSNVSLTPNATNKQVTVAVGPQGSGSGLNADLLDNYHAGNASGQVPVSNGTVCTNLNADMVDGLHSSSFLTSSGGTISSGSLTISGTARFNNNNIEYADLIGSIFSGDTLALSLNGALTLVPFKSVRRSSILTWDTANYRFLPSGGWYLITIFVWYLPNILPEPRFYIGTSTSSTIEISRFYGVATANPMFFQGIVMLSSGVYHYFYVAISSTSGTYSLHLSSLSATILRVG